MDSYLLICDFILCILRYSRCNLSDFIHIALLILFMIDKLLYFILLFQISFNSIWNDYCEDLVVELLLRFVYFFFSINDCRVFQLGNQAPTDSNQIDTSETVYISSLALLKMLKHGRAGVPMEVDVLIHII